MIDLHNVLFKPSDHISSKIYLFRVVPFNEIHLKVTVIFFLRSQQKEFYVRSSSRGSEKRRGGDMRGWGLKDLINWTRPRVINIKILGGVGVRNGMVH